MCVSGLENLSWSKSLKLRKFVAVTSLSDVAHKCNITQNMHIQNKHNVYIRLQMLSFC